MILISNDSRVITTGNYEREMMTTGNAGVGSRNSQGLEYRCSFSAQQCNVCMYNISLSTERQLENESWYNRFPNVTYKDFSENAVKI